MSKCIIPKNITGNISKPSNKVLDIIEVEDEGKSQDKNLDGLFDDIDSSNSDTDDDADINDNGGS